MSMVNQYTAMARVYDAWMNYDRTPYDKWAEYIHTMLRTTRVPGSRVLDVGCGTGQMTSRLQAHGWNMVGVDASADMIEIARSKNPEGPTFHHMRLPDERLATYGPFTAAISCFDTVNYFVRPGQLTDVFHQVGQQLLPGGLFIFDTNTRYKLEKVFGQYHSGDDFEDFSYVWRNSYNADDHTCYIDLTFFVRDTDGRYERFTERHAERWFTREEVAEALRLADMRLMHVYDAYSNNPVKDDTKRTTWVAERIPAATAGNEGIEP